MSNPIKLRTFTSVTFFKEELDNLLLGKSSLELVSLILPKLLPSTR